MNAAHRPDPTAVETEVREKIHLEILKRTGAYHANDHVLLPSGQHTSEYIEKTLVTTEPSFTEGLGAVIAKLVVPPGSTSDDARQRTYRSCPLRHVTLRIAAAKYWQARGKPPGLRGPGSGTSAAVARTKSFGVLGLQTDERHLPR